MSGMVRLVAAELNRLRSRRLALLGVLAALAAAGLFQVAVHSLAAPPTADEVTANQQAYDESVRDWDANHQQWIDECVQGGDTQENCERSNARPSTADYGLEPTPFAQIGASAVSTAAYLSMLTSFLVAASFIGAEYSTGSLANWLTFVPQRLKVFAAKVAAVAIGSALLGAVLAFTSAGLSALQVAAYDQPLTGSGHVAAAAGRVVLLSVVAGLVGFALALLTRHTVAALGVPLAYVIVAAVLTGFTRDTSSVLAWLPPYLPDLNLAAFLEHGTTYSQYAERVTPQGVSYEEVVKHISFVRSSIYWLVVALVAVVPSALVFRRRDVT